MYISDRSVWGHRELELPGFIQHANARWFWRPKCAGSLGTHDIRWFIKCMANSLYTVSTVWPHSCVWLINCEFVQWDIGTHVSFFWFSWHHCMSLDFPDVPYASVCICILEIAKYWRDKGLLTKVKLCTPCVNYAQRYPWNLLYLCVLTSYMLTLFHLICCVLKPCVNLVCIYY